MGTGTLTKYSASAGSGKTFRLTSIYLSNLFRDKDSYRKILAVTFTNKATAEMKGRILDQLYNLSTGKKSEYLSDLMVQTGRGEHEIRKKAGELLHAILHDYSSFTVCTIDAFFQKIIRAFARESGLHSGYSVELDHSFLLSSAVDEMIASSSDNPEIREWLSEYVNSKLSEEKSWNPKNDILRLAEEIFRERFKMLSVEERSRLEDKKFLLDYIAGIRSIKEGFEETMFSAGEKCARLFSEYGLTDDMFYQKSKGVPGFVRALASGRLTEPKTYVRAILADPPKWSAKTPVRELQNAISAGLEEALRTAIKFYDANVVNYNSSKEILTNIYAVGILSDILKRVRLIASSENSFLISDAGELLRDITSGDQAPFIYEKIGNRYENYMIDEFQDTSLLQWDNFFPLIDESMGRGNNNLVVGDIKQSIYRFRNSDWRILGKMLDIQIPPGRLVGIPLATNWRSAANIIRFNNTIFSLLPESIDKLFEKDTDPPRFSEIYAEAIQGDPGIKSGGYVRLEFVENDYGSANNKKGKESRIKLSNWEEKVLDRLPELIEQIQDKGYSASDIGIIVRYSNEGTAVLNKMIRYSNSCSGEKKTRYNYKIVSDYSLALSNSPVITFIISALRVLNNYDDDVSRAAMLRYYLLATGNGEAENVPLYRDSVNEGTPCHYPEGHKEFMQMAACQTLFEAVENIIGFYGVGEYAWNVAYLSTFQDLIINFSARGNNDFASFLDWWEITGSKSSVVLPAVQDAARIFTIHKSKGLEFKVVILPFLSWNDDHNTHHHEITWVRPPDVAPFNQIGIVPVRYRRNPPATIFSDFFRKEKYSAFLDNLNLLYVALTRAKDAIFGFAAATPDENNGISRLLREAVTSGINPAGESGITPALYYDDSRLTFEFGEISNRKKGESESQDKVLTRYTVYRHPESLKLKIHGENYFISGREEAVSRINYGKMMHQAFEYINTADDIPGAVDKLVLEGLIPASDSESMIHRLYQLISSAEVKDWFRKGNRVVREAAILNPSGSIRRPDRVILEDDRAVVIDFKFGEERGDYQEQIAQYCKLLSSMGYMNAEGYIWYVDRNKIISVR